MRVLQVHKYFHPHAGSETVLFHTRDLLSERGHDVLDFSMEHPSNVESPYQRYFAPYRDYVDPERPKRQRAWDAVASVYSPSARARLRGLLRDTRPDIAHLHLIYHHLTLSLVDELAAQRIPMVMTLHDYKIGCPAYVLYRDGQPCSLCTKGAVEHVAIHKCIKGSRPASALAAVEARLARLRGSYRRIDGYVAPSAFAGRVAADTGIDPRTIHVVPNFLPDEEIGAPVTGLDPSPRFFFAGRLEHLKGVRDLLAVFSEKGPALGELVIAGAGGELVDEVEEAARGSEHIHYLGRLSREAVREQLRGSRAMLVPSRWHENNPMSLLEARAVGIPVVCTDLGGLPEMVDDGIDGLVVPAGSHRALADAIRTLARDRELAAEMGRAGHARLQRTNTPAAHYRGLMGAYEAAMGRGSAARGTITA